MFSISIAHVHIHLPISPVSLYLHLLVLLQALIWLTILAQSLAAEMSSTLGRIAASGAGVTGAACRATLLAGLDWVDLTVGELGLLNALVGLAVLAQTVVLWKWLVNVR